MKDGAKTRVFSGLVFLIDPPFKEKSHFLEKVVLLARRSARKRNKITRSFGGEGNRTARSLGQEWNRIYLRCQGKGVKSSYPLSWINGEYFYRFISSNLQIFP